MKKYILSNGGLLPAIALLPLLLLGISTARADQDISFGYSTPVTAHVSVSTGECDNSGGPTINLGGEIDLGDYKANVTYYQNVRKNLTLVGQNTQILLTTTNAISLPKQPPRGGVGGNPYIWIQFFKADGANGGAGTALGDKTYLGRCVQGFQADPNFLVDVLTKNHIKTGGCSNRGGPTITLGSTLTVASGLWATFTFSNQGPDNNLHGLPEVTMTTSVNLLVKDTSLTTPDVQLKSNVGGNPYIKIQFFASDSPVTDVINLGRCNTL